MEISIINEQKYYENYIFPLTYEYKYHNPSTVFNVDIVNSLNNNNINSSVYSNDNNEIDTIIDWLSNNKKAIDDHLLLHKAILFR